MEKACGVIVASEETPVNNQSELKRILESGDESQKIEALKKAILLLMAGEKLPQLLMTIIRYVLTSKNHTIKKLLLMYWEVVDMIGPNGQLLPEMILVCNSLRNDLIHPNEYVRGSTMRFLCKIKIAELLEPLVPSIIKNLEHRHSYVRRNAILALGSVFTKTPTLCPNAPDLVFDLLENEEDASCKRNAIIMLYECAQDKAIRFLNEILDKVSSLSDTQQFAVIDLIRRHTRQGISDAQKAYYVRGVISLLSAQSSAVQYEAACALLELSPVPISAKAAASTFIELLCSQSDNNIKLITLEKLNSLKKKYSKVLQELLMDVLRALACPTLNIRQKTLDFAMDLVNPRNIDGVVQLLKKEISKTHAEDVEKGGEYRKALIKSIHSCALKFPDVAGSVVLALMDHLGDDNAASAIYVVTFVGEVVETYPEHRNEIVAKLLEYLGDIKCTSVLRIALWIVGEYSETLSDLDVAFTQIKTQLGAAPFYTPPSDSTDDATATTTAVKDEPAPTPAKAAPKANRVLADGTYASQSALISEPTTSSSSSNKKISFLRDEITQGNFVIAAITIHTLTKIGLKLQKSEAPDVVKNAVIGEILLYAASLIQFADMPAAHSKPLSVNASREEIIQYIKILLSPEESLVETLLIESREAHKRSLKEYNESISEETEKKEIEVQPDDLIPIRLLQGTKSQLAFDDEFDVDLIKATGANERENDEAGELSKVYQLTGFSDPLYAECYINVHRFDIVLEVLVINRTKDTLQNVSLELSTLGDLKLAKRSLLQTYTIGPLNKVWIRSDIKVSSTETGVIYGNLVYDIAGTSSSDKNCVILNNIRVDIIDYIKPAVCSDSQYRTMWYEFEWENKVPVNAKANSVFEFLSDIVKATNMKCLTPKSAMQGDCRFLAANLYAKSIFGEDALANMSVEQLESGEISGYIRIRSKTQGVALSLGDKIAQRSQA